jgi:hypothetical protein
MRNVAFRGVDTPLGSMILALADRAMSLNDREVVLMMIDQAYSYSDSRAAQLAAEQELLVPSCYRENKRVCRAIATVMKQWAL